MDETIITNPSLYDDKELSLNKGTRSYMPSLFIAASLPLRNVNKNVFERNYNNVSLKITSAELVPYGKNARLLLSLITTYSVINQDSRNCVRIRYDSISELCRELKLPRQRGKEIIEQLEYFSTSSFVYQGRTVIKDVQPSLFSEFSESLEDLKVSEIRTGQVPFVNNLRYLKGESKNKIEIKGIEFEINERFSEIARRHAVPINYDVYKDINSSLGKDLYAWLCYRNNGIFDSRPVLIGKDALVKQFLPVNEGLDKDSVRALRSKNYQTIIGLLKEIKENYYKELKIQFLQDNSGIVLYRSPSPVLKEDRNHFVLVTDVIPE